MVDYVVRFAQGLSQASAGMATALRHASPVRASRVMQAVAGDTLRKLAQFEGGLPRSRHRRGTAHGRTTSSRLGGEQRFKGILTSATCNVERNSGEGSFELHISAN